LGGWDNAPSRPSAELVLKENGSAQLSAARDTIAVTMATTRFIRDIIAILLAAQGSAPRQAELPAIPLRVRDVFVKEVSGPSLRCPIALRGDRAIDD
jgi:hypothetical protein